MAGTSAQVMKDHLVFRKTMITNRPVNPLNTKPDERKLGLEQSKMWLIVCVPIMCSYITDRLVWFLTC